MGLTPEQYVETIPAHDLIARAEAEIWLGISSTQRKSTLTLAYSRAADVPDTSDSSPHPACDRADLV